MSPENDPPREGPVRAQEAIVRALAEALRHLDPESPAAAGLRTQLIEESARLAFRAAKTDPDESGSAAKGRGSQHPSTYRRSRVLIVEDDDGTRMALAGWLSADYEVLTARDGEEGFAAASASPPDVIVTDLWMPRVDGMSMVQRLRSIESLRTVQVIFLTGQTATERARAGIQADAIVTYLPKPIELDSLEEALRAALRTTLNSKG
jgi:CheY-like chemotaxis protein